MQPIYKQCFLGYVQSLLKSLGETPKTHLKWPKVTLLPPTTTFPNSIFEVFSALCIRFSVSKLRRRFHRAVFAPDSDLVVYVPISFTVPEIYRRPRFLRLLSLRFLRLGNIFVGACLGVPGSASAYCGFVGVL